MTVTPQDDTRPVEQDGGDYDVVIIGAGISGIGAAYRLAEADPSTRYVILERRDRVGGTWDLFRYPGVRSDSSIFSLSWPWEPWTGQEYVADGDVIRDYMEDAARKHGIFGHIRFHTTVVSADWDSATDTWTVHAQENGTPTTYRGRFVFFGSGYYDYDRPHSPDFPGIENFGGRVVHAQHWPEDLDYAGKNVVVIGSGATAVSLAPALARTAGHVTMLQRSPGYLFSMPRVNRWLQPIRKWLPNKASYMIVRGVALSFEKIIWIFARGLPAGMKKMVRWQNTKQLPAGYPVDRDFKPRYNPWDQRMCLVADGDVFTEISKGRLEVVTDHIDHVDASGIALTSGRHLDADVIVKATGLNLLALGGVRISVDGTEVKPQERFSYKAHMLEDVPNLIWCIGYTNASWTLRADITARATAKLLGYMKRHGYTHAYPHISSGPMAEKPTWDLQAGYVLRNAHALPKSGTKRPWVVRQDFLADAVDYRFIDKIDEDMVFGRVRAPAELTG
ncbi:NAD(P)/FAD-dependent oxidoreductase [Mycolicibacterium sp.]|uniref:flavin-containing monooxygenase n=1 Tax=Mycolicibacterium sp. TaxID=2320850 RepID=UPI001DDD76B6|nr:NAD(P)/FAD-dependent oxidoreductase [Mycolicibacterium sp.]MCB1291959.1 NAD(P)/FAD-dependent oxidoreductase [Mycobacterium sp.]MCB9409805.1 NAD(P)/FAD-dependent oxidoreductase [Mycolicibacterium sp.]